MKTIAIDFDKTVVTDRFPQVGEDAPGVVDLLSRLTQENKIRIILYTMRDNDHSVDPVTGKLVKKGPGMTSVLEDAIQWYKDRDIPVWAVNSNPSQRYWTSSKKIYNDFLIDDHSLGCPMTIHPITGEACVDWEKIAKLLEDKL